MSEKLIQDTSATSRVHRCKRYPTRKLFLITPAFLFLFAGLIVFISIGIRSIVHKFKKPSQS